MKISSFFTVAGVLLLTGCHKGLYVEVSNPLDVDRHPEMVELNQEQLMASLSLEDGKTFIITRDGEEVPYQVTYDGKVVFPVDVAAGETQTFKVRKGTPSEFPVKVCGKHYPERVDDICWENDVTGYRIYGFKEDAPSGYDFFTKRNTDMPVIDDMYRMALDPERKKIRKQLAKTDKDSSERYNLAHMSFHVDHGFGADCYGVGPTLGGGTSALVEDGKILYPACYDTFEILDNGPVRFTLKITFRPVNVGGCADVVETRVMTLDLGSHFTRTDVSFAGLDKPMSIVTGIVLQDTDGTAVGNAEKGYIAYPAPTMNFDKFKEVDNGTIFVGNAFPFALENAGITYFSEDEKRGTAKGHILAHSTYNPGTDFTYYWGFGWNHSDMTSYEQWLEHLETFTSQLRSPLTVTIK